MLTEFCDSLFIYVQMLGWKLFPVDFWDLPLWWGVQGFRKLGHDNISAFKGKGKWQPLGPAPFLLGHLWFRRQRIPYLGPAPIQILNKPITQRLITLWPRIKEDPSVCSVGSECTAAHVLVGPVVLGESVSDWDAVGIRVGAPRAWEQNCALCRK